MLGLFDGSLTYWEFGCLLARLPGESALRTEIRDAIPDEELAAMSSDDGPHGSWSREATLLAAIFDAIGVLINVQISRAGVQADPPEPLRRPGVVSKQRKASISPQMQAAMESAREKLRAAKAVEAAEMNGGGGGG